MCDEKSQLKKKMLNKNKDKHKKETEVK